MTRQALVMDLHSKLSTGMMSASDLPCPDAGVGVSVSGGVRPASREVPMNLIHALLDLAQATIDVLRIVFAR